MENNMSQPSLQLYNSLERQKVPFTPLDPDHVTMYVCGPTVYDRAHIGNARAIVVFDVWYRLLRYLYPRVTYVRNITDVDDKINAKALERGVPIEKITQETTRLFHEDMAALHCLTPTVEPRATEHIEHMVQMITSLIASKHAYVEEGHVLFSVASYEDYGSLSRRSRDEMIAGARIEVAPYKKDPGDFVLWKPSSDNEPGWDSPWGRGRPGWHIECSAMSTHYLSANFDIHGGGADLQFPHHENEIAQSCCAHADSGYARYWVHNGFLTVEGEKMSKSLGNFITVEHALENKHTNHSGQVIRAVFLATHYRKPLDWNAKAVSDARKTLDYLYKALELADISDIDSNALEHQPIADLLVNYLCDDLNTSAFMTQLYQLAKDIHTTDKADTRRNIAYNLLAAGKWVGLFFKENHFISPAEWFAQDAIPAEIKAMADAIYAARAAKNWPKADALRDKIQAEGYALEYLPDGKIVVK